MSLRSGEDFDPLLKLQESKHFTSSFLYPLHGKMNPQSAFSNKHTRLFIQISDTISCPLKQQSFAGMLKTQLPISRRNRQKRRAACNIFLFCHLCFLAVKSEQLMFERKNTWHSFWFQIVSYEMHKYYPGWVIHLITWWRVVHSLCPEVSCLICYFTFKIQNCQHRTAASSSLHITVIGHIFHQKLPKDNFKDDTFLMVSHFLPDQRGTIFSYIGD